MRTPQNIPASQSNMAPLNPPNNNNGPESPTQNGEVNQLPTPAQVRKYHDTPLSRKLVAMAKGEAAAGLPVAVVNILVSTIAASIREGKLGIAGNVASSSIGTTLQMATLLGTGAAVTTGAHFASPYSPIHIHDRNQPENDALASSALISAAMGAGGSLATSIGFDLAGAAMMGRDITSKVVLDTVVDQVIGGLVTAGVITAGTLALYKSNESFRNTVERTLNELARKFRKAQPEPQAGVVTDAEADAMELGRMSSRREQT